MEEINMLDVGRLRGVEVLFTDIDDTLSTSGKLTAGAFEALWRLHDSGLGVVVVTGRPAGWCDHIARFWPVDAVVGENGGFYFYHDGRKLHRRHVYDEASRREFRAKLDSVRDLILRDVPGAAVAADQPFREYDLAIDFCEDVDPLPRDEIVRIKELFEEAGAHARISSIHVNGWYGEYDKLSTAHLWVSERLGMDLDAERDRFVYCGDSPNDEPMFAFFPLSFGMANVRPFLSLMHSQPAYVTSRPCGEGFCEVADLLLRARPS